MCAITPTMHHHQVLYDQYLPDFFSYCSVHFTGIGVGIFRDGVIDSCEGGYSHFSPHMKLSDCNPGDSRPGLQSPSVSLVTHGCDVSYPPPSLGRVFSPLIISGCTLENQTDSQLPQTQGPTSPKAAPSTLISETRQGKQMPHTCIWDAGCLVWGAEPAYPNLLSKGTTVCRE